MRTKTEKAKITKKLLVVMLSLVVSTGFAQVQDTLYIYKAGILFQKLAVANVDSITFTAPTNTTTGNNNFIYTLVSDDYSRIGLAAQAIANNGNEFDAAKAIGINKLFIDTISAGINIPLWLPSKFMNATDNSTASITYNFYSPCDTTKIAVANKYTLLTTDYDAMGTTSLTPGQYDYFSSKVDPSFYIPIWLKINNPYAKTGDLKLIRYMYFNTSNSISQNTTVFVFNGTNWIVYNTTKQTTTKFKFKNNKWFNTQIISGLNSSFGSYTIVNVVGTQVWSWSNYGYALMAGYSAGSYFDNEDWLISPPLDLTDRVNPVLSFNHAGRYFGDIAPSNEKIKIGATLWVSTKSDGVSINPADWTQLVIPDAGYPTQTNWTFVTSTPISLAAYVGKNNVRIAFKYVSHSFDNSAGSWEVKNVSVVDN